MKIHSTTYGMAYEEGKPSSDAFAVRAWDETIIAVLADGAGTGDAAREAANRTVQSLIENYQARPRSWSPQRALSEFTSLLNRTFYHESLSRFERPEMVSTVAAAVIEGGRLYGMNVGDSRVCLVRAGSCSILSRDHIDSFRPNVLTRALGMAAEIEPHIFDADLMDGDMAVLCSDGVSNQLDTETLSAALAQRSTARHLVKAARDCATPESMDDMSAIVLDIAQTGKLRAMNERPLTILGSLKKGDVIDGYELIRNFQRTDRVWLSEKDGHRMVLKFAPMEAIESEPHLNAFTREVWNATRLDSECFVRASEPASQTARYYVMEFVNAPNLATVLETRRLSVDSAVSLGKFLAEVARILLRHDLAHGDIKPENILCIGDYEKLSFKLVDLGSAAEIFSVTSRAGTASYLAPERFREAPLSERTEIFSIGVTLYQSLTGVLPYGAIERFQTPAFHPAKRPSQLNANIPLWLDAVILQALARDPSRRFQNYSEVAFNLANPDKVEPYFEPGAPLLDRNPLKFFRTGFFLLLGITIFLLFKLIANSH